MSFTPEVIIATYNKPDYLRLCLKSIAGQSLPPSSICLADDGSDERTRSVMMAFQETSPIPIRHSWHEDQGFRKSTALNKAIASSDADYLVFLDDDVILHPDFLKRHIQRARRGRYLTGSLIRLNADVTKKYLMNQDIAWDDAGRLAGWLPSRLSEYLKSMPFAARYMGVLDRLSPVSPNFQGACASVFRSDALKVNGFNEAMAYGGLDKEFGARLKYAGVKGFHVRYSAPVYHLDHGREYANSEIRASNRKIIETVRREKKSWTSNGIQKQGMQNP